MKLRLLGLAGAAALMMAAAPAMAAGGELHIYNWGNYTNPKLIEKFTKETGIKVTLDNYDSNETMLAKVRAGGTGYDIVVPSDYTVKIMIDQGMLAETKPNQMPNFKNVKPQYVDIYWDKGRNYTVPWQFGTTAFGVNTAKYKGDINTYAILFDPPDSLKGRINMLDDEMSVIHAAERYLGVPRCGADPANLKKVNDLLQKAKPYWRTISYDTEPKMTSGDVDVTQDWNGDSRRIRLQVPTVVVCLSQGRHRRLDGQRGGAEGRPEHGECEGVPELPHGPGERGAHLRLRQLRQRHHGQRQVHACRFRQFTGDQGAPRLAHARVRAALPERGGGDLQQDLDQSAQVSAG